MKKKEETIIVSPDATK
jgi:hypothetical protein